MPTDHDQLAKRILEELLDPLGTVRIELEVPAPEPQSMDLWFTPTLPLPVPCPGYLLLIQEMAARPGQFEPFSSTPTGDAIRDCLRKQLVWLHLLRLEARRKNTGRPALFPLWVITPGCPESFFHRRRVRPAPGWPQGFYFTDEETELWFVVIAELQPVRQTLVLRLLGARRTRREALAELRQIPEGDPDLPGLRAMVAGLRQTLGRDTKIPEDEREDFMTAGRAEILQMQQDWRKEGIKEGSFKGQVEMLLMIYESRLGTAPDAVRGALLGIEDPARLKALLALFLGAGPDAITAALLA